MTSKVKIVAICDPETTQVEVIVQNPDADQVWQERIENQAVKVVDFHGNMIISVREVPRIAEGAQAADDTADPAPDGSQLDAGQDQEQRERDQVLDGPDGEGQSEQAVE